jgi:Cys-tRNA(Pro) deacylase
MTQASKPLSAELTTDSARPQPTELSGCGSNSRWLAAQMMPPAQAERVTGYKVGGISPLGRRRPTATLLEACALDLPRLFVNGGQRGLQIEISPQDLVRAAGAVTASFT